LGASAARAALVAPDAVDGSRDGDATNAFSGGAVGSRGGASVGIVSEARSTSLTIGHIFPLFLSELRIIHAHIGAAGVGSRKIEFEFKLDFLVVNAHFARNSKRNE